MPELPEVETVMRGMAGALCGQQIAAASVRRKDLRVPFPVGLARKLSGRRITAFSRRAKYIVMSLDDGYVLVIHLGMSGRVRLYGPDEIWAATPHDHFVIHLADGACAVLNDPRRFGMVLHMKAGALPAHKLFASLGPEPLEKDFNASALMQMAARRIVPVKQFIMDQRIVVGVGNIYACEALFQAGIDPARAAGTLKIDEWKEIVRAVRAVLRRAIKAGGSSLRDYRQTDGALGYFQHQFKAYGRAGEICGACGGDAKIMRIVQGGRATFYCPRHQK